ncbi:MAG: SIS domain-containing protein [Solirubrobacterales bacterium]
MTLAPPEGMLEELIARRLAAGEDFFGREGERLARCCHLMAERFARGGRLMALGATPPARSDARHVSVEFVHPVIVGKRALPAIALTAEGGPVERQAAALIEADDIAIGFGVGEKGGEGVAGALTAAHEVGCMTIAFPPPGATSPSNRSAAEWSFTPPGDDPYVRQEIVETAYHVLWELVHVFFDHRGLLEGREKKALHDPGASSFLYPFLSETEVDLDAVLEDVRLSAVAKSEEIGALREATLSGNAAVLAAAAETLRGRFADGGRLLALGNGGSATDAMDVVADFRDDAGAGWQSRRALDLTEDAPILTAVANDVGVEEIFQRQVIAYGREGDVLIAFSTSGGSENLLEALAEARRRRIETIAMVGYDGGRIAAEGLADHVVVTRSQNIPRIQEAQASAYHVLRHLVG